MNLHSSIIKNIPNENNLEKDENDISIIILAAGKGTRMKSNLPKVMHQVAGRAMLQIVIDEAKKINPKNITILISAEMQKYQNEIIKNNSDIELNFALQLERRGTGDAVKIALQFLQQQKINVAEKILILYGDTPLLTASTMQKINNQLEIIDENNLVILGFENQQKDYQQSPYGRLIIDNNKLIKIVEFKDANNEEKSIKLCNGGIIAIKNNNPLELLNKIDNKNASQEFYLTDIVAIANQSNIHCSFIIVSSLELLGVNSKNELAEIEKIKQEQLRKQMMESGVTMLDPSTIYLSCDTKIGAGSIIHQNVIIGNNVEIAEEVEIKPFSHLQGCRIKSHAVIGPFARIRAQTEISESTKIGNFVEIKNSKIEKSSKINHLSYIGDSYIGESVSIGAGTITCNYNGFKKFYTTIENNAFIGSNSCLIAPVNIGNNAIIGAGSIIDKNVKANSIAISRPKQKEIENGAIKFKQKHNKPNN